MKGNFDEQHYYQSDMEYQGVDPTNRKLSSLDVMYRILPKACLFKSKKDKTKLVLVWTLGESSKIYEHLSYASLGSLMKIRPHFLWVYGTFDPFEPVKYEAMSDSLCPDKSEPPLPLEQPMIVEDNFQSSVDNLNHNTNAELIIQRFENEHTDEIQRYRT